MRHRRKSLNQPKTLTHTQKPQFRGGVLNGLVCGHPPLPEASLCALPGNKARLPTSGFDRGVGSVCRILEECGVHTHTHTYTHAHTYTHIRIHTYTHTDTHTHTHIHVPWSGSSPYTFRLRASSHHSPFPQPHPLPTAPRPRSPHKYTHTHTHAHTHTHTHTHTHQQILDWGTPWWGWNFSYENPGAGHATVSLVRLYSTNRGKLVTELSWRRVRPTHLDLLGAHEILDPKRKGEAHTRSKNKCWVRPQPTGGGVGYPSATSLLRP